MTKIDIDAEKAATEKERHKVLGDTLTAHGMPKGLVQGFIAAHGYKFPFAADGKLMHKSGMAADTYLDTKGAKRYSDYFPKAAETDKEVPDAANALADRAAVEANQTLKGKLVTMVGEVVAREMLEARGTTFVSTKPGKALAAVAVTDEKKPAAAPKGENPWSAQFWNVTKQGQILKAMGEQGAIRFAANVGCKLGDTKPNPAFK